MDINAQQQEFPFGRRLFRRRRRRRFAEQFANAAQILRLGATGEQAVVADALKAAGQDVAEEASQELVGGKRQRFADVSGGAVAVVEDDLAVVARQESRVTDGDAVGVVAQVVKEFLWAGEGGLAVDDPRLSPQLGAQGVERGLVRQGRDLEDGGGKDQPLRGEESVQSVNELAAEDLSCPVFANPSRTIAPRTCSVARWGGLDIAVIVGAKSLHVEEFTER